MSTTSVLIERLSNLRAAMSESGLQAWIVPATDPHQSEYFAEHWHARDYYSGFTGSAGVLVVTATDAGLWTDSRYYLQAEQQLPAGHIQLFKSQEPGVLTFAKWLGEKLNAGDKVGMNGWLLSGKEKAMRFKEFAVQRLKLVLNHDLSAKVWQDRPALPEAPVFEHPVHLAGKTRGEKLAEIRLAMEGRKCQHHLVSPLDDIAWTLNLRGNDVDHNPVFYAYLLISIDNATLFIDPGKLSAALQHALASDGIEIQPYEQLSAKLQSLEGRILIDDTNTASVLMDSLPSTLTQVHAPTLSIALKAIKNPIEIAHLRNTMAKDGVALLRLFRWLEANIHSGPTELDVSDKLCELRAAMPLYYGESFPAIVGYAGNGAIVHYRPGEGCAKLRPTGILLLDSGGQYQDGTTDITRTVALGTPSALQRRNFTLVLKGHIGLATAKFPEGTGGYQLDVFARAPLWQHGLNFGHGTGHGVGFFLSVHEGPQSIRHGHSERSAVPMQPGMLTSNEPGYYETGQYGIRIENLVLCIEAETTAYGRFLGFETISFFPIDLNLVDADLLTTAEREWLNAYHAQVQEKLWPLLDGEEREWLNSRCAAI